MAREILPINADLLDRETPVRAIFLHGYACTSADWVPVADRLSPGRYLLVDFPGHGLLAQSRSSGFASLVEMTTSFLRQLPTPAIVVGHSMGGMVAMSIASSHPELVRGLILADAFPYLPAVTEAFGGPEDAADPFGYGSVIDRQTPQDVQTRVRASMATGVRTAGTELHAELMTLDLRSRLSEIDVPTLALVGDRHGAAGLSGRALTNAVGLAGLSNLSVQMVPSHHFIMLEQPLVVARYIEKFILGQEKTAKGKK